LFGWIQFFTIPDIKPFFTYGWDEHMFRLVGTFLDPTFLGLIIVFGLLITIHRYIVIKEKKYIWMGIFLLISLAFTYSRASYLAFGAGLLLLSLSLKRIKQTILIIITLLLLIVFLPTSKNHSIEFFRSFSALARIDNYSQTLKIFKTSPLLGIGYNNMCAARNKYLGPESFSSHACSGSDSSLLLILATTGVIGLISFIYLIYQIWKNTWESPYALILNSLFLSLLVHSLFSNSIFYSWIIGYMIIILALNLRGEVKS
jgi:O-antigen ligase